MDIKLDINGVTVDELGLTVTRTNLTDNELDTLLAYVGKMDSASRWLVADAVVLLETAHGYYTERKGKSKYDEMSKITGIPIKKLYNYATTARWVPRELRKKELTFSHHMHVATHFAHDKETLVKFLDMACREKLNSMELRDRIHEYAKSGGVVGRTDSLEIVAKLWRKRKQVKKLVDDADTLAFGEVTDALAALNPLAELYHKLEARYLFLQNAADGRQDHIIEKAIDKAEKKRNAK